ncbi:MAG: HisA/HisF-related TIM barrel protein [Steroidobacteraceae bacterium]
MELIPAIDLRNGHVVRLRQGDFDSETRYAVSALELARQYRVAGARRVHVVDLEAARRGKNSDGEWLRTLASSSSLKVQIGGGVRRLAGVSLFLDAGAERVVIGSVAVHSPTRLAAWIRRFGRNRIVAALDVRIGGDGSPWLASHAWKRTTRLSLWRAMARLEKLGLKHAICTDIGRDGLLAGPNVSLYAECVRRFPAVAWQASGGLRDVADLRSLAATGIDAAISGRALLEQRIPLKELSPFSPAA